MALSKFVVTMDMHIGSGSYGDVYRLPDGMCVKVFHGDAAEQAEQILAEIEGSSDMDAVPVLDLVDVVVMPGPAPISTYCRAPSREEPVELPRQEKLGVLKPYVPLEVDYDETDEWIETLRACNPKLAWDIKPSNIRKDYDGRLWLVDTSVCTWC